MFSALAQGPSFCPGSCRGEAACKEPLSAEAERPNHPRRVEVLTAQLMGGGADLCHCAAESYGQSLIFPNPMKTGYPVPPQTVTLLNIFLSYSTKDLPTAQAVANRLRAEGYLVYLADETMRYGASISSELDAQIKACDVFIVLWSRNAKQSEWVSSEVGIAKAANREILPVILEEGLLPPALVSDRKFLPAYQGFQQALEWLSETAGHHHAVKQHHEEEQRKKNGLALLGLGALVLFALSSK